MISKISLSEGRGSVSFLMGPVKGGMFVSNGVGGSLSNLCSICVKNDDFLIVFCRKWAQTAKLHFSWMTE